MCYYIASLPVAAAVLLAIVRGHWGIENNLYHTLDMQFQEDDGHLRRGHEPTLMGTVQQNFSSDVPTGLLWDKIGRHLWLLATALP